MYELPFDAAVLPTLVEEFEENKEFRKLVSEHDPLHFSGNEC